MPKSPILKNAHMRPSSSTEAQAGMPDCTDTIKRSSLDTEQRNQNLDHFKTQLAKLWQANEYEFDDWFLARGIADKNLQLSLLRTAHRYQLNPLLNHLDIVLNDDAKWSMYIPIDGWIYLLHQHSQFAGLDFRESEALEHGIPTWMECTIHRKDHMRPITIREYACELQNEHPAWQSMPRRMLRHKVLQEAMRLGLGIAPPILTMHGDNLFQINREPTGRPRCEPLQGKSHLKAVIASKKLAHTFNHQTETAL